MAHAAMLTPKARTVKNEATSGGNGPVKTPGWGAPAKFGARISTAPAAINNTLRPKAKCARPTPVAAAMPGNIPVSCGRGSPLTVAGAAYDSAGAMGPPIGHSQLIPGLFLALLGRTCAHFV